MPDTGDINQICGSEGGDTLIEVIVAILLVGTIILGLVPLYSQVRVHVIMDTSRVTAYNLAESQIQAIKSAHYGTAVAWAANNAYNIGDKVRPNAPNGHIYSCTTAGTSGSTEPTDWTKADGSVAWQDAGGSGMGTYTTVDGNIVYGDPPGQFPQHSTIPDPKNNGIVYNMTTQIRWKPDPSKITTDGVVDTQINYNDYKDITVEVKAQTQDGTKTYQDVTINTMVAAENEWEGQPGGNIQIRAVNGTKQDTDSNYYVANMRVNLIGPNPGNPNATKYEMITDNASGNTPGVFFALLPTPDLLTDYQMTAYDNPNYDNSNGMMMVLPSQRSKTVQIEPYKTHLPLDFQVAPASTLVLNFNCSPDPFYGTVTLSCDDATINYTILPGKTFYDPLTDTTTSNPSGTHYLKIINLWPAGDSWVQNTNTGSSKYYTLAVSQPGYTTVSYQNTDHQNIDNTKITLTPGQSTTINVNLSST